MSDNRDNRFVKLFQEQRKTLGGFLYKIVRSENDAEDLAQEAFLRVYRVDDPGRIKHPKAFLYKTAYNLALNVLRARRSSPVDENVEVDQRDFPMLSPSLEHQVICRQNLRNFLAAVSGLPERRRQAFTLCCIYDLPYRQVAEKLGISVNTVENHVVRALKDCQAYLDNLDRPVEVIKVVETGFDGAIKTRVPS